ncbi:cupin domain-containing protein [Mycobacterium sp. NPDC003449]
MESEAVKSHVFAQIAAGTGLEAVDVLGPTLEFMTSNNDFCIMRGVIPPGVTVPLHSHPDAEDFFILTGTHQVLIQTDEGTKWVDARAGDHIRVSGSELHAHRNVSNEPAVDLIVTTARMGQLFRQIARPSDGTPLPVTPEVLARFMEANAQYGVRLGTPEENAAVGIDLPVFSE